MVLKNKTLSDERIVELFFARDEAAITGVDAKYGSYLHTIAVNILSDCEDCEECKNDTYLALWNNIPPDCPSNFKAYVAKVIRNISINRYKEKTRQKRVPSEYTVSLEELAECIPDKKDLESVYDAKHLQQVINSFALSLSHRKRYIFICRYFSGDSIHIIADSLKISGSMVFYELTQIRKQLKKTLKQEGFWNERGSACECNYDDG